MAINKAVAAALKALSYIDFDVKNNYMLERKIRDVTMTPKIKYRDIARDYTVDCGDHAVPVRVFLPQEKFEPLPVIIYLHGGGWVVGSLDTYYRLCSNLAHLTNHIVLAVDYRLAPEHKFPAGLDDCCSVIRYTIENSDKLEIPDKKIYIAGDSAGGNLCAVSSLWLRDMGYEIPKKQILIYPATGNDHDEKTSPFDSIRENGTDYYLTSKRVCDYLELYLSSKEDYNNPYFAPLLANDLSNQPDTLVITAEYDPLRDEGEAYAEALKKAGNHVVMQRIPDAIHGFFSLPPYYSMVRHCYDIIRGFLS